MNSDIIIVGSGFAGAIAAARLADAGLSVCVLERGPWRDTRPVSAAGITDAVPFPRAGHRPGLTVRNIRMGFGPKQIVLHKRGLLEIHFGRGIRTVTSSSVGGGSHIWGGVVSRPLKPDYWDCVSSELSEARFAPHFARVQQELGAMRPEHAEQIPNHTSYAWRDMPCFKPVPEAEQCPLAMLFPEKFGGPAPTNNRIPTTMDGNDGMFGSPGGAKASVDAIYLIPRLGDRLQVHDLHEVQSVTRLESGYKVMARDHRAGKDREFTAPYVMLAAGTMNTIRLLCAAEESGQLKPMAALGLGFGSNGDCAGVWEPGGDRDSTLGTGAKGALHIDGQPEEANIFMGGAERPPLPSWLPRFLADKLNAVGHKYQIIGMGPDRADGRIRFTRGRLELSYDYRNSPIYEKIFNAFDILAEKSGKPVKYDRDDLFTCHPLGGCRISESNTEGVVNSYGEVYANPGLFITDASVFPAPTGLPPSLNIAAWSSFVAEQLIKRVD